MGESYSQKKAMTSPQPIFKSQPRHLRKIHSVPREQQAVVFHRDAGNSQIHRADANSLGAQRPQTRRRIKIPWKEPEFCKKANLKDKLPVGLNLLVHFACRGEPSHSSTEGFFRADNCGHSFVARGRKPCFERNAKRATIGQFLKVIRVEDQHRRQSRLRLPTAANGGFRPSYRRWRFDTLHFDICLGAPIRLAECVRLARERCVWNSADSRAPILEISGLLFFPPIKCGDFFFQLCDTLFECDFHVGNNIRSILACQLSL